MDFRIAARWILAYFYLIIKMLSRLNKGSIAAERWGDSIMTDDQSLIFFII